MQLHYLKNEIAGSNKSLHPSDKLSLRKMFKHETFNGFFSPLETTKNKT